MTPVFADTFYFLALLNDRDASHDRVQALASRRTRMVTSGFVLLEVADGLASNSDRSRFPAVVRHLRNHPLVTLIDVHGDLFNRALALYASRPDKQWSLTDCSSFIIMQDLGVYDALTADHHFEQAGFTALLK